MTGVAMFGAIGYMPISLQIVNRINATESVLLLPTMLAGALFVAGGSGFMISKCGRYKWTPIAGAPSIALASILISTVTTHPPWQRRLYLGLGLAAQILVLVVEKAIPRRRPVTARRTHAFFREIGASVETVEVDSLFVSPQFEAIESLPLHQSRFFT